MKKCLNCKLINPNEAEQCDCGYNFVYSMVQKNYGRINAKHKPIIQIILTTLLLIDLLSLFCIYNSFWIFAKYWDYYRGIGGLIILWCIAIVSIIITLVPMVISWIVYYRKYKYPINNSHCEKE
jgi:hypothetical protein